MLRKLLTLSALAALTFASTFSRPSAQYVPLADEAVKRDMRSSAKDLMHKVLIDGEGSLLELVSTLRRNLDPKKDSSYHKENRFWIAEVALDNAERVPLLEARIEEWRSQIEAGTLDRFGFFDNLLACFEPMLAAQDTEATDYIGGVLREEFPTSDVGHRIQIAARVIGAQHTKAADAIAAFLDSEGWDDHSFYAKQLQLPKYEDDSGDEYMIHSVYWRALVFPVWMPHFQRITNWAYQNPPHRKTNYALPELDLWAVESAKDKGLAPYLRARADDSKGYALLYATHQMAAAIANADGSPESDAAITDGFQAYHDAYSDGSDDRVLSAPEAWWFCRAQAAQKAMAPERLEAFEVALQQIMGSVIGLPRSRRQRAQELEGLTNWTAALDAFGAELMSSALNAKSFLTIYETINRTFVDVIEARGLTSAGDPSRMAVMALRTLAQEKPALALEILNNRDLVITGTPAFFLPIMEGMNGSAYVRMIPSYYEIRTQLLLDTPVSLAKSFNVSSVAMAKAKDKDTEFLRCIERIMGQGEEIDIIRLIDKRSDLVARAAELAPKELLALASGAIISDKLESVRDDDSGNLEADNILESMRNFHIQNAIYQALSEEERGDMPEPSIGREGERMLGLDTIKVLINSDIASKDAAQAVAKQIVPEDPESELDNPNIGALLRLRLALVGYFLEAHDAREGLDQDFEELIYNHSARNAYSGTVQSLPWMEWALEMVLDGEHEAFDSIMTRIADETANHANDDPSAPILYADPLFAHGYPQRLSNWLGTDHKALRALKQKMIASANATLSPDALFSPQLNSYAWSLHLASTEPEITERAAHLELVLGSAEIPGRKIGEAMGSEVITAYTDLGISLKASSVGAPIDTRAWGLFESGYKEEAIAMEEWALRLSPGHQGFKATLAYFRSHDAPKAGSVKKPAKEPAKEPVKEPAKNPVKEPAKDPVKEPAKDPVKEPAKDPVKEPAKEPAKKPSKKKWWRPAKK